ncbi:hypothetical protein OIDMADRAFT_32125 [Oidiodendron maius Zn]|uniref:RING-type domain-containing protein n=1 Tax=Oidiodendron maius (strain Zn) TaxID=913774 RepID=A0A0C3D5E8_OIDMZ|nr:hypothetical protein OIDMADRAFT_32125 [Oidiodendron maius Zn]
MSVGVGGKIKQSIIQDENPADYWCDSRAALLNVTFLSPPLFEKVTGMACPPSPITMETYQEIGYPMFSITDEVPSNIFGDFEKVKPLSKFNDLPGAPAKDESNIEDTGIGPKCQLCKTREQRCILRPCDHSLCMTCEFAMQDSSQPSSERSLNCPVCSNSVDLVVGKNVPMKRLRKGKERVPLPHINFTTYPVDDGREPFRNINFGNDRSSIKVSIGIKLYEIAYCWFFAATWQRGGSSRCIYFMTA